jgi:hypothetical protein
MTTATVETSASTDTSTQATEHAGATGATSDPIQTSQQTDPAAGATTDTAPEEVSSGLVSAEDYAKVKDDPGALRKALLKGYTQKTQQLASQRNELGTWAQVREAYAHDPVATMKALAAQSGLEIRDPKAEAIQQTAQEQGDQLITKLRATLDPFGLGDAAEALAPVFRELATQAATSATEPIRKQNEQIVSESAQRESAAVIESFGKKYPDWKTHEPKMVELSQKIQPAEGMDPLEWMEHLYTLAAKDSLIDRGIASALDKMKTSAQSGGASRTVAGHHVAERPGKLPSFAEAYEAAKRGSRFE